MADDTGTEINEAVSASKSDSEPETEVVAPEEAEAETEDPELAAETENAADAEAGTEEHFLEPADGTDGLDTADFASMRLVVLASDADMIVDPEHVIANYDTIYLLQYSSAERAMNAYVYYRANADAVEPDAVVTMASGLLSDEGIDMDVTEEQNPILALSEEGDSDAAQKAGRVIALIDTGASEGPNVIDRVSLIDDALEGSNSHADDMVAAIVSQNPGARILSIRALGDDGRGTVSSIVAAMEYAINQNVSIINLSLYAKNTLANSVLETEIKKAAGMGIVVVGAAGNAGADVKDYTPGCVEEAWIIGACDLASTRLESSNYGDTVDYLVVGSSTSEAAAKFSGLVSLYGIDVMKDEMPSGIVYIPYDNSVEERETVSDEDEDDLEDFVLAASTGTLTKGSDYVFGPGHSDYSGYDSSYGVWQFRTHEYTMTFEGNDYLAYCLQPEVSAPSNGHDGTVTAVTGLLRKGLLVLYGGPAWGDTVSGVNVKDLMDEKFSKVSLTKENYYVISHFVLAALYYYDSSSNDWNSGNWDFGLTSTSISNIKAIAKKIKDDITYSKPSLSPTSASATVSGDVAKSATITYKALDSNTAKVTVPKGVTLVNETTGKSTIATTASKTASLSGGDKFHLEIPTTSSYMGSTKTYSMSLSYAADFAAYRVTDTGAQNLGFCSAGSDGLSFKVTWPPASGYIKIEKRDANTGTTTPTAGFSLEGAKYGIYSDAACTKLVETLTIGADGTATSGALDEGSYWVREDSAAYKYGLDVSSTGNLNVYNLTVTAGQTTTQVSYDQPQQVTVKIRKTSTAGSEILGLSSYYLTGMKFGIYKDAACTDANRLAVLTVQSEDGYTETYTLPHSSTATTTYYIREIQDYAAAGHKWNSTAYPITVTMPADAGTTKEVAIPDDPEFTEHELNVEKKSSKGNAIEGAIFKVEYFDAQLADPAKLVKTWYLRSDGDGIVKMENRFLDPNRKSDSFFTWNGNIVIPIGGYLRLTEIEAPAEFIVDDQPVGFLTTKTVELTKKWPNTLEPCEIRLKKYDTNGTTPLAGVEFKLTFVSESEPYAADAVPTYKPLLKVGESTTVKTDSNGEITFSNLDQGTYQITEVSTVSGRTLLKDPIVVTLPIKLSQSEIDTYGNVDTSKGKVDSVTGKTFFYDCLYEVTNTPTFKPPMTGSTGTWKYGFIGIAMIAVIGAGVVVCTGRRRKRKVRKA